MRVRILVSFAAANDADAWQPGQVLDLPEPLALALADGERAELIEEPDTEAAVERPSRLRGGKRVEVAIHQEREQR